MPQPKSEAQLKAKIIAKALKDPAFKQALISNPKQALADEFDIYIPAGIEVQVLEETKSLFYLVIPSCPKPDHGCEDW